MSASFGQKGDVDSDAFLTAAGIIDPIQYWAIIKLTRDFKRNGLWSKMKAIYPFVGGTATTHKWNLKDPRDINGAYRLSFVGGWTHSSTGADPNGINSHADTFIVPSLVLGLNNAHISAYTRENVTAPPFSSTAMIEVGGTTNEGTDFINIMPLNFDQTFGDIFSGRINSGNRTYISNNDSRGHFLVSRLNSTNQSIYKNGSLQINGTVASNSIGNVRTLYISAGNSAFGINRSPRETAFVTIGDGLTELEVISLYNIIQTYQTTLGRQV